MTLELRTRTDVDPWQLELIVVRGTARSGTDRGAIARDTRRGLLLRLGPGVYVERHGFESLTPEQAHIVRMRALAATSPSPLTFSHWSAAVALGLPVLRSRLTRMHITSPIDEERRRYGTVCHCFPLDARQRVEVHGLLLTDVGRTVLDIAGAAALEEGVIAGDAALRAGVPRGGAGRRPRTRRTSPCVPPDRRGARVAHPGAESAAESRTRVTVYRLGVEIPELQHRVELQHGRSAFLDEYFPGADAGLEIDGDAKYLSPSMAPAGAAAAVLAEKRREDEVRTRIRSLARIGWTQSGDASLLGPVLWRIGIRRPPRRPTFDEWCEAAREARPRRRLDR